jgi:hypothetical protein
MADWLNHLARDWRQSSLGTECTLQQLAPYIGKLKTTVAARLIERYSGKRDKIIDPLRSWA